MRTGLGFDVHAFCPDRPLVLGGVLVPFDQGLLGHSDADVLTHAVMDALLGAAGLGDIGLHFPDTDEAYRGADSIALLRTCAERVWEAGYAVGNVDAVVIAQAPKLAPHREEMRARLAEAMGVAVGAVNVKATTTEHLGFTGRGEGITAQAVCLLEERHV